MGRGRRVFPIALAASLALHAIGTAAYLEYWRVFQRPAQRPVEIAVQWADPDLPEMGDNKGTGIGSNSSPGEHPLEARQADEDQALLSRDPVGLRQIDQPLVQARDAIDSGAERTMNVPPASPLPLALPPMQLPAPAEPSAPPAISLPTEDGATLPAPDTKLAAADADLALPAVPAPGPAVKPGAAHTPSPPVERPVTVAEAAAPQPRQEPKPAVPVSTGDPVPPSESDSDPFSRLGGSVVFHDGRLDVRLGRKVKTIRPQIGIGGVMDAISLNYPSIVLEVHIDPTGHVSDVEFARKSGSVALDGPTRNAVYQWWFEPAHDKSGKAISDVIFFTIEFR